MNASTFSDLLGQLPGEMLVSAFQNAMPEAYAADDSPAHTLPQQAKKAPADSISAPRLLTVSALAACMLFAVGVGAFLIHGNRDELTAQNSQETEQPDDSKAEAALPVYYSGSSTMDRRLPTSNMDLMNYSDAIVIAEAVAEKEQIVDKTYNTYLREMVADGGYTVVSYKVDQVLAGDIQEGDTLDIREYHYNSIHYNDDGTITDCIISRSNAKPSMIGEKYLLYLTKWPNDETWCLTFDEYGIYTYDDKKVGSWLREDMDQESYDYKLYQVIFMEVAAQMDESGDT